MNRSKHGFDSTMKAVREVVPYWQRDGNDQASVSDRIPPSSRRYHARREYPPRDHKHPLPAREGPSHYPAGMVKMEPRLYPRKIPTYRPINKNRQKYVWRLKSERAHRPMPMREHQQRDPNDSLYHRIVKKKRKPMSKRRLKYLKRRAQLRSLMGSKRKRRKNKRKRNRMTRPMSMRWKVPDNEYLLPDVLVDDLTELDMLADKSQRAMNRIARQAHKIDELAKMSGDEVLKASSVQLLLVLEMAGYEDPMETKVRETLAEAGYGRLSSDDIEKMITRQSYFPNKLQEEDIEYELSCCWSKLSESAAKLDHIAEDFEDEELSNMAYNVDKIVKFYELFYRMDPQNRHKDEAEKLSLGLLKLSDSILTADEKRNTSQNNLSLEEY